MKNRIARVLLFCCLGCSSGCAVLQSPQVIPEEWRYIDKPEHLDAVRLEAMLHQPRDLDESVDRTHKLLRQYARAGAQADSVPQAAGTALTALGAYGGYRSVVHPSAHSAAALLGAGGAIYTASSGVKWGERAAAYTGAGQELNCLLEAARPYLIRGGAGNQTGQQRLASAHAPLQSALVELDLALATYAAANEEFQTAPARTTSSSCPASTWGSPLCTPVTGADSTLYQRNCRALDERYKRLCAPGRTLAVYSVPAPEVAAAFARAKAVAQLSKRELDASSRLRAAADDAGSQLWTGTLEVMLRAFAAVRRTGFDLPALFRQIESLLSAKAVEEKGRTQGGPELPAAAQPDADRRRVARPADDHARQASSALLDATARVIARLAPLQDVLAMNGDNPRFSNAQFNVCVSAEAGVAQTVVRAAGAPAAAAAAAADQELVAPTAALYARLKLAPDAPPSEIESAIRACQDRRGIPHDGKLTRAMEKLVLAGDCEKAP